MVVGRWGNDGSRMMAGNERTRDDGRAGASRTPRSTWSRRTRRDGPLWVGRRPGHGHHGRGGARGGYAVVVSVAHAGMAIMAAVECRLADAVVEAADLVTADMVSRPAEDMAADMECAATVVAGRRFRSGTAWSRLRPAWDERPAWPWRDAWIRRRPRIWRWFWRPWPSRPRQLARETR